MPAERLLFILDVDNTLLDNDRAKAEMGQQIEELMGQKLGALFWSLYEEVRHEKDYVDYPATLERFGKQFPGSWKYAKLCALVLSFPYEHVLFPRALEVIRHLRRFGVVGIVSDGDPVYQAAKIGRSGLAEAVAGPVLLYVHKEQNLEEIQRRLPADHYVFVDDKPALLGHVKQALGARCSTVLIRQGHYARAPMPEGLPQPEVTLDTIADLLKLRPEHFT